MRKIVVGLWLATSIILVFFIAREFRENNNETDTISLHIGKPYRDVIRDSTFPVKSETVIRATDPPVEDSTWFSSPVIVNFDDPQYGFTLPPTKFGAVGYNSGKVTTVTTSPMLETLPFDQLVPLLMHLQAMLKASTWQPEDDENYTWLKLEGEPDRNALQNLLFNRVVLVMLRIPYKYSLALNVKCYARCDERDPETAKYLIDISVGEDFSVINSTHTSSEQAHDEVTPVTRINN